MPKGTPYALMLLSIGILALSPATAFGSEDAKEPTDQIVAEDCKPGMATVDCYREALELSIRKQWAPHTFPDQKQATVRFILNRDGQLVGLRMKQSSGIPALDESIQEAVIAAAPFKALPTEIHGNEVAFEFTFDYFPPKANESDPAQYVLKNPEEP